MEIMLPHAQVAKKSLVGGHNGISVRSKRTSSKLSATKVENDYPESTETGVGPQAPLHTYADNELSTHTVKWNVCVVVCVLLQVGKLPTVTLRQLVGCNLTCERQISPDHPGQLHGTHISPSEESKFCVKML